jgi:hypothetical protein
MITTTTKDVYGLKIIIEKQTNEFDKDTIYSIHAEGDRAARVQVWFYENRETEITTYSLSGNISEFQTYCALLAQANEIIHG